MTNTFDHFQPYDVEGISTVDMGRLRHAADRGDHRARLTLAKLAAKKPKAQPVSKSDKLAAGRDLYRQQHGNAGSNSH